MVPGLNLEQAPPFWVPLRFFLTAPAFALLAAAVALWEGPALFDSRWSAAALAVTHLLTLGFVGMAMVGALMQILPVLAGAPIRRPRLVAGLVHPTLAVGTLSLAAGFLFGRPVLLAAAVVLLGAAFAVFLYAMAASLIRVRTANVTLRMLRFSGLALAVTVALGLWLAASRAGLAAMPEAMRDLHPAWGFLGWWGLLLLTVAYRVVPMFQLTPGYPAWISAPLGLAALGFLAVGSIAAPLGLSAAAPATAAALAGVYVAFAVLTLILQRKRRRRQTDVNMLFWRVGMLSVVAAPLAWAAASWTGPRMAVLLGVLVIAGAAMSVVNGMLYKIVPFLAWFHLQARARKGRAAPHMGQYLAERSQRRQLALHAAALLLLIGAAFAPQAFAHVGAAVFAASALLLFLNLLHIARAYRAAARALAAAPGATVPQTPAVMAIRTARAPAR